MDCLRVGNSHNKRSSAQYIMSSMGRAVQAEILALQLKEAAPAYMDRVFEYLKEKNTTSKEHILTTLRASASNIQLEHEPWPNTMCIAVGKYMMQAAFETVLFTWSICSDTSQLSYLEPTDAILDVIDDIINHPALITVKPPMILPPLPHETLFSGGYLTDIDKRGTYSNKNITRKQMRDVADAFKGATKLKEALNKAQCVPYRVNKTVLALAEQARALGVSVGMPSTKPSNKPVWYLDGVPKETYTERQLEEFTEWKVHMRDWYGSELTRRSQLYGIATTVTMAREFSNEPELYFPTCVDWRYRLYFKSSMNPQGSDLQKAILEFANAKPLGERGLFWLKVHVATCYGYDKHLFELRAAWVDANLDMIRSIVASPLDSEAWAKADAPWCFLAAAIELAQALDSTEPTKFMSRAAVAMDATNSGSQHYSAMLRDPVGGRLTNLFWEGNETKADMYMNVKERTDSKVIMDLSNLESITSRSSASNQ